MTTLIMPGQDERIQTFEVEEFEIPCDIFAVAPGFAMCDGTAPARWIARREYICSCGVILRLPCDACKVKLADPTIFRCMFCHDYVGQYSFEPLRMP